MSVIDNVDLDYIHNEIAMDNSHDAINIIVEGMTDAKLMEDFTIEDYVTGPQVKDIPIAI